MIKAIILYHNDDDSFDSVYDEPTKPPIEGVVRETQVVNDWYYPVTRVKCVYSARLNDKGEAVLCSEQVEVPQLPFEKWCEEGFDHTQEIKEYPTRKNPPFKEWKFSRKLEKHHWVVIIETLEQLEELLDKYNCELTREEYYAPNYVLRIYE